VALVQGADANLDFPAEGFLIDAVFLSSFPLRFYSHCDLDQSSLPILTQEPWSRKHNDSTVPSLSMTCSNDSGDRNHREN